MFSSLVKLCSFLALIGVVGGCEIDLSGSKKKSSDKKEKKADDDKSEKKKKKKKKKKSKKKLEGDKMAMTETASVKKLLGDADDDKLGFASGTGDAKSASSHALVDTKLDLLSGDDDVSAIGADFDAAFSSATETVEPKSNAVIGTPGGETMVWRYVDVLFDEEQVVADVERIVLVGGSSWQTVLLAVDDKSGSLLTVSKPPVGISHSGQVSELSKKQRFSIMASRFGSFSGAVTFAMASSTGNGIQNALAVAHGNVSGGKVQGKVRPNVYGYLSGRKYVARGTDDTGRQIATQLHFVMYLSDDNCMALQVNEIISQNGNAQRIRIGGCATYQGGQLAYQINAMCLVQGSQEQCKKVSKRMQQPLELYPTGMRWGTDYQLLNVDGGTAPTPQPPAPEPAPDPKPTDGWDDPPSPTPSPDPSPDPTPQPKGKKGRSYSDRDSRPMSKAW
jgi:hypothetical protein